MKGERLAPLLLFVVWTLILVFAYTFVLFGRLGMSSAEYKEVNRLAQSGDVAGLNQLLVRTPSVDAKLIILLRLEEKKDLSSIPYIIQVLDYELPWWGRLWGRIDPSELRITAAQVRYSAYDTLTKYGGSVTPILEDAAKSEIGYRQLYTAALLYRLGHLEYKTVLLEYVRKGRKYEDDIYFVERDLSIDLHDK